MGTSGNRDCQWASRSVLKDFTEDALTISAGSLLQNETVRMVKANWPRRVQHLCWWNLYALTKVHKPNKSITSSIGVVLCIPLSTSQEQHISMGSSY